MTSRTRVDVFSDVFAHVDSEILSFQQIERAFVFEVSRIRVVMILLEKLSSEKF